MYSGYQKFAKVLSCVKKIVSKYAAQKSWIIKKIRTEVLNQKKKKKVFKYFRQSHIKFVDFYKILKAKSCPKSGFLKSGFKKFPNLFKNIFQNF